MITKIVNSLLFLLPVKVFAENPVYPFKIDLYLVYFSVSYMVALWLVKQIILFGFVSSLLFIEDPDIRFW